MFCPRCRSEYRPGFARCADCDVELVASLPEDEPRTSRPAPLPSRGPVIDYCGFFSVQEAREARDRLRSEGIRSEIVIREPSDSDFKKAVEEEYWIRFAASDLKVASRILGYDEAHPAGDKPSSDDLTCSACGRKVAPEEGFCPHCGARFENAG